MADEKRPNEHEEQLRHKSQGHGTHGAPTGKEVDRSADRRDLPEGNGATGKPAAFPDKEP